MDNDLLFVPNAPVDTDEYINWHTALKHFLQSFHDIKKGEDRRKRNKRERRYVKMVLCQIVK
ncbi:hypothetical protein COW81_00900 [Candidatus Campbellbacteria bacterium CG22_combo_CG10-13_8_21_14_all_36_13]|uniref:Uncharacterized protein n=1 Tax=Candidatus Campbellbacteria bacterium CG22_combo_CG10-13_8_21_14_all_36_13 TaxID=1974529 RepID=A0A2H0E038_9BACT|nr:MAG: hypothetical protein COW81_00900 [Candidatus Campbellbacteria bacterium CG22_combo_CG10-13_8_21_14_all_36_13]